jgi:hypothetical protein
VPATKDRSNRKRTSIAAGFASFGFAGVQLYNNTFLHKKLNTTKEVFLRASLVGRSAGDSAAHEPSSTFCKKLLN